MPARAAHVARIHSIAGLAAGQMSSAWVALSSGAEWIGAPGGGAQHGALHLALASATPTTAALAPSALTPRVRA